MGKRVKGSKGAKQGKGPEGPNDLELVKDFLGDHAYQVSRAMVTLAEAVEAVLNQHNAALLAEMRIVANQTFDAAEEALRNAVSNVQ